MVKRALAGTVLSVAVVAAAAAAHAIPRPHEDLVAHEWGTFTTVAGPGGESVAWRPLDGPADLPCFVERTKLPPKWPFWTLVRMETPVIYFHTSTPMTVDVAVRFPQGLITEVFPRVEPYDRGVQWRDVRLLPGAAETYPYENVPNHYYAARVAHATPLDVEGAREGFLFYRGIGDFDLPLRAVTRSDGMLDLTNSGAEPVRGVIVFENRGGSIHFRVLGDLSGQVSIPLEGGATGLPLLRVALLRSLTSAGLYAAEAEAMVSTWDASWFEEGARVFYLVPPTRIDEVLPLEIRPRPRELVRVFVGRVEFAPAFGLQAIERALQAQDRAALEREGRFAAPFARMIMARTTDPVERAKYESTLGDTARPFTRPTARGCQTTTAPTPSGPRAR